MRDVLIMAALAASFATASSAKPMMHHHRMKADSGSAEVRALNEKSLQQANAGSTMMATPGQSRAMSDAGTMAPADGSMSSNNGSMNASNGSMGTQGSTTSMTPATPQ